MRTFYQDTLRMQRFQRFVTSSFKGICVSNQMEASLKVVEDKL